MRVVRDLRLAVIFVLAATPAAAQSQTSSVLTRDADGRVIVHATRIMRPIAMDGRLDDEAYRDVSPITEFVQQEPNQGAAAGWKSRRSSGSSPRCR